MKPTLPSFVKLRFFISLLTFLPILSFSQIIKSPSAFIENDDSKLKHGLQSILKKQQDQKAGINTANNPIVNFDDKIFTIAQDSIMVDAIAESEGTTLVNELKSLGIKVVAHYEKLVTCWVAINDLPVFEKVTSCSWVEPVIKPTQNSGIVQSQGDSAQRSGIARAITGLSGEGVKVGVLSDSYNHRNGASTGISNGELPGIGNPSGLTTPVTVIKEMPNTNGSDEGRAMLEIVHDVAPKAQLYFYTAFVSKADFATGITSLANQGCKVIVDDVGYFNEAFFQDDVVAKAINEVKANSAVSYFTSAGNSKNYSYESAFRASSTVFNGETFHNFSTTPGVEQFALPFTYYPTRNSGAMRLFMQWDQPYKSLGGTGATTDLNIYVAQLINGTYTIIGLSGYGTTNNLGIDPYESISGIKFNVSSPITLYLLISKKNGQVSPGKMKFMYHNTTDFNAPLPTGFLTSSSFGHPNAEGAISVGASNFNMTPAYGTTPPVIASYSSHGGMPMLFDQNGNSIPPLVRNKPEIVAPDGANTSFFTVDSNNDADTYPNFFGTSAAAPHAAAVAALMLQAKPSLTPNEVRTALINSCTDMETPGFDFISGYGLIKADNAILSLYSITATGPVLTTLCVGSSISVPFNSVGKFGTGNIYKLQLSDASGSFNSPINIGTLASTANTGSINGVIPSGTTPGANYKIRIIGSLPAKGSNEIAITITAIPTAPTAAPVSRCGTGTVTLTATGCAGGTIKWFANATATTTLATSGTFTTPSISANTTYYVGCTVGVCNSTRTSVMATISTSPAAPSANPVSRCGPGTVTLTATGCAGGTIKWFANATATTTLATSGTFTTPSISANATYYVGCSVGVCNSTRTSVAANVTASPAAPSANPVSRCGSGTVTLSATGCAGGTIKWFANATATTTLATGGTFTTPSISANTTYYIGCSVGVCNSTRTSVAATVNTTLSFTSPTQASGVYSASQTITSASNVASPTSYRAGKSITLVPGFQAGNNETFLASIQNCP